MNTKNKNEKHMISDDHYTLKCIKELKEIFKNSPVELWKIEDMELLDNFHLKLRCWLIVKLLPENWPSWKLWNGIFNVEWVHIFSPKAAIKHAKSKKGYKIPSLKDIDAIIGSIPSIEWQPETNSKIIHELLNIKHPQSKWKFWVLKLDHCRIWTNQIKNMGDRIMYRSYEFDFINQNKREDWRYFHDNDSAYPLRLIVDWDTIPETFMESIINKIKTFFSWKWK